MASIGPSKKRLIDPGGYLFEKVTGSSFASEVADPLGLLQENPAIKAQKEAAARQEELIARQRQKEQAILAERRSEIAIRSEAARRPQKASLLVTTSPQGVTKLGGTA